MVRVLLTRTTYLQQLQELNKAKADHDIALQKLNMFVELKTYLTVAIRQANSIVTSLEEQANKYELELKATASKLNNQIFYCVK